MKLNILVTNQKYILFKTTKSVTESVITAVLKMPVSKIQYDFLTSHYNYHIKHAAALVKLGYVFSFYPSQLISEITMWTYKTITYPNQRCSTLK